MDGDVKEGPQLEENVKKGLLDGDFEEIMDGETVIGIFDKTADGAPKRTKRQRPKNATTAPKSVEEFWKDPIVVGTKSEPSWMCNICQKRFVSKSNLQIHTNIHTGERYVCDICRKCFTQKCNLKRHEQTHAGTKLFSCVRCGKKFTQKANLQRHFVTHSGKRSYACEECGKSFIQKCNLKKHMDKHAENVSFPFVECVLCEDSS